MKALKDKIAVVGVGTTAYGSFPEISDYGLAAHGAASAATATSRPAPCARSACPKTRTGRW